MCRISTCVLHASKRQVIPIIWSSLVLILMMVQRRSQLVRFQVTVIASPQLWPRHGGRLMLSCSLTRATAVTLTATGPAACACRVLSRTCVAVTANRRAARHAGRCFYSVSSMLDRVQRPDVLYHSAQRSEKTRNGGDESNSSSRSCSSAAELPICSAVCTRQVPVMSVIQHHSQSNSIPIRASMLPASRHLPVHSTLRSRCSMRRSGRRIAC